MFVTLSSLPSDSGFLLRFLRVGKFSQLEALRRLERYLTLFTTAPGWVRDLDPSDPKFLEILDTG